MPNIKTLIPDIYRLVGKRDGWFTSEIAQELATEVSLKLQVNFGERKETKLRLSKMGPMCPCHLWHSIHRPELAEALPGPALIKFAYGHMIEAMAIALAKAAGHSVTGEQDELDVAGVKGHRDCVLDGHIVDVKSCSSRMFEKFEKQIIRHDDSFGYLDQLDGYMVGSSDDPLVEVKDRAYIWAIDKTLGKMVLYEHSLRKDHILARVASHKAVVALDLPPQCTCEEIPDGESGNMRLGVQASYSAFKHTCKPGLRQFNYAGGPRWLTRVVRRPFDNKTGRPIQEVDRYGRTVYN